ncbi:hypothetical protein V6N12_034396 [Hibiscus sabdariffa]|uniref:BHLH domain-containing protein n=1 Tax=Hibiscus sabdariffa TaxID=183260 RepID=A0ABR2AK26_9ROSI
MAEEFHGGICGGAWWNSTKPMLTGCSPPCSTGVADMGSFGYGTDMVDVKAMSYEDSIKTPVSDVGSIVLQAHHPPLHQKLQQADSDSTGTGSSILVDSTLQMLGFNLPSSTTSDWNLSPLRSNGRIESYQEDIDSRLSYRQETDMGSSQILNDWCPKSFSEQGGDSSITAFEPVDQEFPLQQPRLNSVTGSGNGIPTCLGLSAGFPMASASYGYPSTLLHSLFESDSDPQTLQQSLFSNRRQSSINYMSPAAANYGANANELSTFTRPSLPKPNFLVKQTFDEKPNRFSPTTKTNFEKVGNSGSATKKGSREPAFKRPKLEALSPLPTFKVRKEKLGDRITALQQLVSPFGKTDTASVLHEAIEYIKFLHDQVNVLNTPYMKQAAASQLKDPAEPKQDLRSRGLCLVPMSSTFPKTKKLVCFAVPVLDKKLKKTNKKKAKTKGKGGDGPKMVSTDTNTQCDGTAGTAATKRMIASKAFDR